SVVVRRGMLPALAGATALLEAAPHDAAKLVEPMRAQVGIAAINGPRSVVVSGTPRYIDTLVRRARRRDMVATRLPDDVVADAPLFAGVPAGFGDGLAPMTPHTPVYSTARRAELIDTAAMDGEYWAENASRTVELAAALERAAADGLSTVLEVAPHSLLASAVQEYPEFRDATHAVASRDDEAGTFLACVARLHLEGRPVDWSAQGPFGTAPRRVWRKRRLPSSIEPVVESGLTPADLTDDVVEGVPTVPAAHWLRGLLALARTGSATVLTDFVVHERVALAMLPEASYRRHGDGSLRVEVTEAAALASARPGGDPTPADIVAWMRVVDANRAGRHRMRAIEPASRYAGSRRSRPAYGPGFRVLRGLAVGRDCAIGLFELADPDRTATLDGCLHLLVAAAHDEAPAEAVPLPVGIASAWLSAEPNRTVLEAHAFLRERTAAGLTGDIIGTDQDGVPCLALSGVRIRFAERTTRVATASRVASFREETWQPIDPEFAHRRGRRLARRALVIGASGSALRLADALAATLPIEHVRREPDAARPLLSAPPMGRANTSVVLVYAGENDSAARPSDPIGPGRDTPATTFRVLDLLQRVHADDGTAALTIVLPTITDPRLADPDAVAVPHAIAGLVRSLQLESHRVVRLVWTDTDPRSLASLADLVAQLPDTSKQPLGEIRITAGTLAVRRFTPALLRPTATAIDPTGTYVVTGGLGAAGAVAVRWLLESGARDVVVLTRAPRPVPPPLDGLEDRIVVVRCDAADPRDLAYALNDIRACGSTVRGVVHAAGATTDAAFEAITARQLTAAFAPRLRAARNLIALTATDPTDFILLFSDALGALGTPGRAADAAATAAMDSLARTHPGRGVLSVGWGGWATGSAAV
ncbi:KR domain-containing protein, partial [Nocardia tenerifensis]